MAPLEATRFRPTVHQFNMCSKFPKFPHSVHLSSFLASHLLRLSGVLRPLTDDFSANESTPLGTLLMMLLQETLLFSIIHFMKSPCITSLLTFLFQFFF